LNQFEIWWADLPKPAGRRPVMLLSRPSAYNYLHKFIVAEITTTIRNMAIEVSVGGREGLARPSVVNCDNLRTVAKSALVKKLGRLGSSRETELKRAVGYALGWEELIGSAGRAPSLSS
jgi:mRNA interferase MazF